MEELHLTTGMVKKHNLKLLKLHTACARGVTIRISLCVLILELVNSDLVLLLSLNKLFILLIKLL